jgi:cyclase
MKSVSQTSMFYGASPQIFEYSKVLRAKPTEAEKRLWEHIRNKKLGVKFRRQHPIFKYIADFYCHERKLVIEIDGKYHLEDVQKEHDKLRSEDMLQFGIKVIRFNNEEVLNNIDEVIKKIKNLL